MLSISNPRKGGSGGGYYLKYYNDHAKEKPLWSGRGAELLGLSKTPTEAEFNNLLNGFSPNGKAKLVQNAGAETRQGFWDLTFSVPKSVSVLWAMSSKKTRGTIEQAIEGALQKTLAQIERSAGFSRRGKGGKELVQAALTFALFFHATSRAEDPQIHWHCLLVNVGIREDGTTGALYTNPLFEQKVKFGGFFQRELERELGSRLGVEIERETVGFHVKGVPKEVCEDFSKRRKDVEAELTRSGKRGGEAAKAAAIKTRGKKKHTDLEELSKLWQRMGEAHGFGTEQAEALIEKGRLRRDSNEYRADTQEEKKHESAKKEKEEFSRSEQDRREEKTPSSDTERQQPRSHAHGTSKHRQTGNIKQFERELRAATDKIFPENQKRDRILAMAKRIGARNQVFDSEVIERTIEKLRLPIHRALYRVEWRQPVPDSPVRRIREFRLPRVVLLNRPRRWGKILSELPIPRFGKPTAELRVQKRKLFRKAPAWSPLSKLELLALKFGPVRERPAHTAPPPQLEPERNR